MRTWLFGSCLLFVSASGLGQSTATESQGMQALVAEVRQLRMDLQATNGNALKAQVLFYHLQFQQVAVAQVSGRLSDARGRITDIQRRGAEVVATLKKFEGRSTALRVLQQTGRKSRSSSKQIRQNSKFWRRKNNNDTLMKWMPKNNCA